MWAEKNQIEPKPMRIGNVPSYGHIAYSPIAGPFDIKLLDFPNINVGVDRIGITITSPKLLSSIQHLGTDKTMAIHPFNITQYMKNQLENLREQGYDIVQKRERFMNAESSVPGHLVQVDHPTYGPISVRVIEWYPFSILIYPNFNRLLKRQCDMYNVHYKMPEGHDNAFEELDISEGVIPSISYYFFDLDRLKREVALPIISELLPNLSKHYVNAILSFNQVEIPHEIKMKTPWEAEETAFMWMIANARLFKEWRIEEKGAVPIFHAKMLDGLRLKLYPKGRIIRFELTYDSKWMKDNGFTRKELKPIIDHAQEIYNSLAILTKPVRLRGNVPNEFINKIKNLFRSEKDTNLLRAIHKLVGTYFKNKYLQDITGLSRHQVYHRIKEKLSWLVSRVERVINGETKKSLFWQVPAIGKHALDRLIQLLEEVSAVFEMIQNPDLQPRYLSVLSTVKSSEGIQTTLNQFERGSIT